jgi:hypothetical protein
MGNALATRSLEKEARMNNKSEMMQHEKLSDLTSTNTMSTGDNVHTTENGDGNNDNDYGYDGGYGGDHGDDDDDGAAGGEDDYPVYEDGDDNNAAPASSDNNLEGAAVGTEGGYGLRRANNNNGTVKKEEGPLDSLRTTDLWAPLDPFDTSSAYNKPLKKGRTYKIPSSLVSTASTKEKKEGGGKSKGGCVMSHDAVTVGLNNLIDHHSKVKAMGVPFSMVKPYFLEFNYVFDRVKNVRRTKRVSNKRTERRHEFVAMSKASGSDNQGSKTAALVAAETFKDDDDESDREIEEQLFDYDGNNDYDNDDGGGDDYMTYDDHAANSAPSVLEKFSDDLPQTYEDLCKAHIQNYMKDADNYAQETHLTRRVADWQSRILPLLEEQDARPEFDIKASGVKIIDKLCDLKVKDPSQAKGDQETEMFSSFEEIVEGKELYEICRIFLASLQLANMGNIAIKNSENDEGEGGNGKGGRKQSHQVKEMDALEFKLLTEVPAFDF